MSGVQSIDRTLNLLEKISESENGISLAELSELTDLHKSTVHRLVGSLISHGYVVQLPDTRYKITYKLYKLGVNAFSNLNIVEAARESIERLSTKVEEVVHLVVRDDTKIIYIDKENSGRTSAIMGSRIGSTAPVYATSVGKSMLFDSSEKEIKDLWDRSEIKSITDKTITNFDEFRENIDISKKRGYAIDDEENEMGIRCYGAPIYDYTNKIIGAVSLSGPISRVNEENAEKYYIPLIEAAKDISKKMGYLG